MKKYLIEGFIASAVIFAVLSGCHNDNEFYEYGRQPVYLSSPPADTTLILDCAQRDSTYTFSWNSKRYYIEYNLILSLDPDLSDPERRYEEFIGIQDWRSFYTLDLDSVLDGMSVGEGETADIYWTVEVVDPTNGWCDEIRRVFIKRCEM